MGRRSHAQPDDSLELLLDTITNAFGGILFLAILIVILSQNMSPQTLDQVEIDPTITNDLRRQLQELEAELSALKLEAEAREVIAGNLADQDLRKLIESLKDRRLQRQEQISELTALRADMSREQKNLDSFKDREERLRGEIEEVASEIAQALGNIEKERASRKISSPFPEERPATKSHITVTLRYGRLYLDRYPSGEVNLDDFAVLDDGSDFLTVTPKPYRGIPIIEAGELSESLRKFMSNKSPASEYIDISIWDDSYVEFQSLRDYLVDKKFEYRLVIVKDGDEVVETFVPDPKVQ